MLQVVDEDSNAVSPHLTPDAQDSHHSDASVEMVEVDISDPHRGLKKQKLKEQNESEYATDKSEEVPNIPKKVDESAAGFRNFEDDELDDYQYIRKYGCSKFCRLREKWYSPNGMQYLTEVIAGITVAFACVPEAVSWALIARLPASIGILAAWWIGFVTSSIGGRPAMISGATGSMAAVMPEYMDQYCINPNPSNGQCPLDDRGAQFIFLSVIFCGFFQFICGAIRLPDVLLRLLPHTAVIGFVNGLAIILFKAEFHFFEEDHHYITGLKAGLMSFEVLLSILIQIFWPRFATNRLPGPLMSMIVVTAIHWAAGFDTPTVESYARQGGGSGLSGEFPSPHWPYICEESAYNTSNATDAPTCTGYSGYNGSLIADAVVLGIILCFVGLIESLLTLLLVNEKTETPGDSNRECLGQGLANIVSGMFMTMGGCAMIGQTLINVQAGGRLRVAGVVAAIILLITVLALSVVLGILPLGALVGVVVMISIETFEWNTFKWWFILPWMDSIVIIVVTVLSIVTNLAVGVGVGIALQALVFSWSASSRAKISSRTILTQNNTEDQPTTVARYVMKGPLFFGSAELFQSRFVRMRQDPQDIIVHLDNVRVHDSSGLEALQNVALRAEQLNKRLTFVISSNTKRLIDRSADFLTSFDYVVSEDNPYYVCPNNPTCRRSCRKQRLGLCSCYNSFFGAFSKMWQCMDTCHKKCCYKCHVRCCKNNPKCMKYVEKNFGEPKNEAQFKAKIVFESDVNALSKLRIDRQDTLGLEPLIDQDYDDDDDDDDDDSKLD